MEKQPKQEDESHHITWEGTGTVGQPAPQGGEVQEK
jgi:hypothetical protein